MGLPYHSSPANRKKVLKYGSQSLKDKDIDDLPEAKDERCGDYDEVDFSDNGLSSYGLEAVLKICRRCPNLRVLKLYKNQIDDEGAESLGALCKSQPWIQEIHLSHNQITDRGFEKFVTLAENSRKPETVPLWLRCEKNWINKPDEVFENLKRRLSLCIKTDNFKGVKGCSTRICHHGCKVHLPHFMQNPENGHKDSRGTLHLQFTQNPQKGKEAWADKKESWSDTKESWGAKKESWGAKRDWGDKEESWDNSKESWGHKRGSWGDERGREEDRPKVVLLAARQAPGSRSPSRDRASHPPARLQARKRKASEDRGRDPAQFRHRREPREERHCQQERGGRSVTPLPERRRDHHTRDPRDERAAAPRRASGAGHNGSQGPRADSREPPLDHSGEPPPRRQRGGKEFKRRQEAKRRRTEGVDDGGRADRKLVPLNGASRKESERPPSRRSEEQLGYGASRASAPERRRDRHADDRRAGAPAQPPQRTRQPPAEPGVRTTRQRAAARPTKAAAPGSATNALDDSGSYSSSEDLSPPPGVLTAAPVSLGRAVPGMAAPGTALQAAATVPGGARPSTTQPRRAPGFLSDDESSPTFSGSGSSGDEAPGGAALDLAVPFAPDSPGAAQPALPAVPERLASPSSESGPSPAADAGAGSDCEREQQWEQDRGCPPPSLSRSRSPIGTAGAAASNNQHPRSRSPVGTAGATNQDAAKAASMSRMQHLKQRLASKAHKWTAPPL